MVLSINNELYSKSSKNKQVKLSSIKITDEFKSHLPNPLKISNKYNYYIRNRNKKHITYPFESQIILDKNYILLDGYTTYLLANMFGIRKINVKIISTK